MESMLGPVRVMPKILVVDDEPDALEVLGFNLKNAGYEVTTADDVQSQWHVLKAQEKGRTSVTEGIPEALPALLRASKVLARSEHLDVPLPDAPVVDVEDEEAFGDLLLVLVAAGRARGWDAEAALREAVRRQARRVRDTEGA